MRCVIARCFSGIPTLQVSGNGEIHIMTLNVMKAIQMPHSKAKKTKILSL